MSCFAAPLTDRVDVDRVMTKADRTCLECVAEMLYVFSARDPISEWVAVVLHGESTNLRLPHAKEAAEAKTEVNRLGSSSMT